jgi:molecular chaperone HscB
MGDARQRGLRALKDPLKRAAYLCELNGAPISAEDNTAMPPGFLVQQLEWREALDEASSTAALEAARGEVAEHRQAALQRLETLLDVDHDFRVRRRKCAS